MVYDGAEVHPNQLREIQGAFMAGAHLMGELFVQISTGNRFSEEEAARRLDRLQQEIRAFKQEHTQNRSGN